MARCIKRKNKRCVARASSTNNKRRRGIIILARVTEQGDRRRTEDGQFRDVEN